MAYTSGEFGGYLFILSEDTRVSIINETFFKVEPNLSPVNDLYFNKNGENFGYYFPETG